ncbi:MAG: glycosyltransferase family 4 protein [Actinomycetota bacterium]|nr:glycosyltransferase family 4 protein [Actinomycetota bacterium]
MVTPRSSSPRVLRLCSTFEAPPVRSRADARLDPIGGMQNHTGELTRELDRRGVLQTVITARRAGAPRQETLGHRAEVFRLGLPVSRLRQLYAVPAVALIPARARGIDVVHAHLGEDLAVLPLAMLAARIGRAPLVVTVHCSPRYTLARVDLRSALLKSLGGWVEGRAEARAAAVIAITPRLAHRLRGGGVDPERIHIIPPGVNQSLFQGPFSRPLPDMKGPRIVYAGRLHRSKSVNTLVGAVKLMSSDARVVLVGDGPQRDALERSIEGLGLGDRVHITGFVPHDTVPGHLAHADVVVLPSVYEELGSVLLEAIHLGRPIVASDAGGIRGVVHHGHNGLLVPPNDPAALARGIDRVLSDPALSAKLSDGARCSASKYDWNQVADKVLTLYHSVIESHRSDQR